MLGICYFLKVITKSNSISNELLIYKSNQLPRRVTIALLFYVIFFFFGMCGMLDSNLVISKSPLESVGAVYFDISFATFM